MRAKHMRFVNKVAPKLDDHQTRVVGQRQMLTGGLARGGNPEMVTIPSSLTTSASRQHRKRIKRAVHGMSHKERRDFYRELREAAAADF